MTARKLADGLFADDAGACRCGWCEGTPAYRNYHDTEWGFPVADDRRLFEKVCLEGFQSGLSWLTILNKRDAFRKGFANFDVEKMARFGDGDIDRLLADAGIVRHRGKIVSAIHNASRAIELKQEFGSLATYFWTHEPKPSARPRRITRLTLREITQSPESAALSKDLKKRGWTFVGPTTMYAFIQAMGLVNDHLEGCDAREAALQARAEFTPPL